MKVSISSSLLVISSILFGCGGGGGDNAAEMNIDSTVNSTNQAPTVTINANYTFEENISASIIATSQDPDGDTLTYQWQQIAGKPVNSLSVNGVLNFTTPEVSSDTVLSFRVTVSDGEFEASADSEVTITNVVQIPEQSKAISMLPNRDSYRLTTSSYKNTQAPVWTSRVNAIPKQSNGAPVRIGEAASYIDINKDGLMDLVSFTGIGTSIEDLQQANIYINNGADQFVLNDTYWLADKPALVHPRKAIKADFNNDGSADVFFLGHGYDVPPFDGETLTYMLSTAERYQTKKLDDIGFWHGGSAADIDSDGDVDVVLVNGSAEIFFYLNDGLGNFTLSTSSITMASRGYFTLELIDIDIDGIADIVMGGHEYEGAVSIILFGDGQGDFTAGSLSLPELPAMGIVLDFDAEDINGDGRNDIVINRTGDPVLGNGFYQGYTIQLLLNDGADNFPTQSTLLSGNGRWFPWVRVQDLDGDGDVDVFSEYKDNYYIWNNQ